MHTAYVVMAASAIALVAIEGFVATMASIQRSQLQWPFKQAQVCTHHVGAV